MHKEPNQQPDQSRALSRREFLRLIAEVGVPAAFLAWLTGCSPAPAASEETPTVSSPTHALEPSITPFPTGTPTPAPTETPIPELSPTTTPPELEYAHMFSSEVDLRKTVGPIDWTKPVRLIIPRTANAYASLQGEKDVTLTFSHPLVVDKEGSWDELRPKSDKFNTWEDPDEKVMVFAGRPSAHPFLIMHSNVLEVTKDSRIFAAEYIRKAMEIEKQGKPNPLLEQSWIFEQEGDEGVLHRTKMKFIHMTELSGKHGGDDFWTSPFYLDEEGNMMVDHNLAWKPDPNNPGNRLPLFPEDARGPQHLTIATCDHGMATIATLEIENVEEVTAGFALFLHSFRLALAGA